MGARLEIYTLGGVRILRGGRPVEGLVTRKTEALLIYLAATRRAQPREVLADLLWDKRTQSQAMANLRVVLTSLRQALGDGIRINRDEVALNPDAPIWLDAAALEGCLEDARKQGGVSAANAAQMGEALSLYQGDFLEGFSVFDCRRFEDWQVRERESLHRLAVDGLSELAAYEIERQEYPTGRAHAARLLELDPLMESAHRQMMLLLAGSGQRAAALSQYETCVMLLKDELEIEPEAETRALYSQIRQGKIASRPPARPPVVLPGATRHNLPEQLSSFIGREAEIQSIQQRLSAGRLVTLVGAGGCGKTRLSIQVAAGLLDEHPDGVWLVELAPLADPTLVPDALVKALDLIEGGDSAPLEKLVNFLRHRCALLVLDNCEHLIGACARLVEDLLRACPRLRILATSREALGVPGEGVYYVPSLTTPDGDGRLPSKQAAQYEAVRLFQARAAAALPGFCITDENAASVAQICRHLDGIPLAIELAAARVRVLPVAQIASRLGDCFHLLTGGSRTALPRHQTLRAAIDWSYALLSEPERVLFRRLSVFSGGWTLEAAEAVCAGRPAGGELAEADILDLLSGLEGKSMVTVVPAGNGDRRYRMLETIRQYAGEQLRQAGEESLYSRQHAGYFLGFAETVARELRGPDSLAWFRRMGAEANNLRGAMEWCFGPGQEAQTGIQLVNTMFAFWKRKRGVSEAAKWMEIVLKQSDSLPGTPDRARVLANYFRYQGWAFRDTAVALHYLEESLEIWRNLGSIYRTEYAATLSMLGSYLNLRSVENPIMPGGGSLEGKPLMEQAAAIFREAGDDWGLGEVLERLSWCQHRAGDSQAALALAEAGLEAFQRCGEPFGAAFCAYDIGVYHLELGRFREAKLAIEDALHILREFENMKFLMEILNSLGEACRGLDEYEQAEGYYREALRMAQEAGRPPNLIIALPWNIGVSVLFRGDDQEALSWFHQALKNGKERPNREYIATGCLGGFAFVAAVRGNYEAATCLFGAADHHFRRLLTEGETDSPVDARETERYKAMCRSGLDEAAFRAAWEAGQKLALDQALDEALALYGLES